VKYRIGNRVLNSDQIVKVTYFAATPDDPDPLESKSACGIKTVLDVEDEDWSAWLRGAEADAFWEAYSGDAYKVVV